MHIANLAHKLNGQGTAKESTNLRAKKTQLDNLFTRSIFNLDKTDLMEIDSNNNLLTTQLKVASEYGIDFRITNENILDEFEIPGEGPTTRLILEAYIDLFHSEQNIQ